MKSTLKTAMLVLVCFSLLGSLAACRPQETFSNTSGIDATLEPTPTTGEIRRAIISALLAMNTRPNKMNVTTYSADGKPHTNVIEFIPPARKHILAEGTEIIVAEGKVFLRTTGTDSWQEQGIPASTYLGDQPVTEQSLGATLGDVAYVRSDILDGDPVRIYSYSSSTKTGGMDLHNQTEMWVGRTDGLPYKMVIDGETLAVSLDPATGENKTQVVKANSTATIVFDQTLVIESPIP